jgi:hypothetical protein
MSGGKDNREQRTMPNLLVMYECRGVVRDAFRAVGINALSLDLEPDINGSLKHYQMDASQMMDMIEFDSTSYWDMIIAHPMCTNITSTAAWAFKDPDYERWPEVGYHQKIGPNTLTGEARRKARDIDLANMQRIMNLPVKHICMENPGRGFFNNIMKPTQLIHPHQFGHNASKTTGLWLKNLPPLEPTEHVEPEYFHNGLPRWANQSPSGAEKSPPSKDRWRNRSETYQGIADSMAATWAPILKGEA